MNHQVPMDSSKPLLPDFHTPPVVEVALSAQFERLGALRSPHFGLLWKKFRDRFPIVEEHSPLPSVVELFDLPTSGTAILGFQLVESPPVPRCWFMNVEKTELIQVQNDRFVHNWRKHGTDAEYPRYPSIRETFKRALLCFQDVVATENLGDLIFKQCEVTYVNHIVAGGGWENHGEVQKVLASLSGRFSDSFLTRYEGAELRLRFLIPGDSGAPVGRLHAELEPGYRKSDGKPMFMFNLTARGHPLGQGIDGVLHFLDLGREWVVRGFASMTTKAMHQEWGRNDVSEDP